MAQRAVAIATRYSTCLSNACDSDFFSTGRASWQPPFAARSMACSAEVETAAAGDNFRGTWAKRGAAVRIAPNRPAEPRQSPLDMKTNHHKAAKGINYIAIRNQRTAFPQKLPELILTDFFWVLTPWHLLCLFQ